MSCGCVVNMKCCQVGEHSAEQFLKTTNDFYRNCISECYLLMQIHPNAKWTHLTAILAIWSTVHAFGVHGGITCHKLQGKCFTRMTALSACFVNSQSASLDIHLFTLCLDVPPEFSTTWMMAGWESIASSLESNRERNKQVTDSISSVLITCSRDTLYL